MITDYYERSLRVAVTPQMIGVENLVNNLGLITYENDVSVEDNVVTLTRRARSLQVGVEVGAGVTVRGAVFVQLIKPQPLPFEVEGTPPTSINMDGSYEFIPDISGGVAPYQISLEGDPDGFDFDPSTGTLSRPPQ